MIAPCSARDAASCPTRSAKVWERYLRYRDWYSVIGIQWPRTIASIEDSQPRRGRRLRPGWLRHPRALSLPLLPSGPDGVRRPELRRSRPSAPPSTASSENPDLNDGIRPG